MPKRKKDNTEQEKGENKAKKTVPKGMVFGTVNIGTVGENYLEIGAYFVVAVSADDFAIKEVNEAYGKVVASASGTRAIKMIVAGSRADYRSVIDVHIEDSKRGVLGTRAILASYSEVDRISNAMKQITRTDNLPDFRCDNDWHS